jgi:major membrane immunogen (membrane-anchored lipoprotein)
MLQRGNDKLNNIRKLLLTFSLFLVLVLTACGNSDGDFNKDSPDPADRQTDNPADYNSDGEYKPVDDMTQDEIQAELEGMLEDSLGQ